MTRPFLTRFAPLALAILVAACNGTNDSPTGPSGSSGGSTPGGSGCTVGVTGIPTFVPRLGGSYPFVVTAAPGCGWTADTDAAWANVSSSSGQGNATPTLSVVANVDADGRSVTVTVGGQAFSVSQATGCAYTLNPTSLTFSGEGGIGSIDIVTTTTPCPWTATSGEGWIRVLDSSGSGSTTIRLDLDPNPGMERHTFLMIAGMRVNVTQTP